MDETLAKLRTELTNAITLHYQQLTASVPDIYGYSLFTEDGISSFGPVANRESAIKVAPDDEMYNYYRYLAVEWSEWDDFGLFAGVNAIVDEIHADDSVAFGDKREAVLRLCLDVLRELDSNGLFGARTDDRFVVICLSDSDEEIMMESAELLNTPNAFAAYADEF